MASFSVPASGDAAEDAARLLQRLGYVVLALGAPCAEALSSRAIFLFFPIGMALLLVAAMLNPVKGVGGRLYQALWSPLGMVSLALIAWAALSLAWTPFPIEAMEHLFKLVGTALLVIVALACLRDNMRAADLYLFPAGVVLAMVAILALAFADHAGLGSYTERIERSGVALVIMLWPAMAGLAARGRNGLARLLMILAAAFVFAIGAPITAAALFVGVLALSFAISDVKRTVFDLGVLAAAIVTLSPLAPAVSPTLARWFFHAKLSSLSGPSRRWPAPPRFCCTNRSGCSRATASTLRSAESTRDWRPHRSPASPSSKSGMNWGLLAHCSLRRLPGLGFAPSAPREPRSRPIWSPLSPAISPWRFWPRISHKCRGCLCWR